MQLISVKFRGRNRQSNSNQRKDGAGGSDDWLALDFFQKIPELGWWIDVSLTPVPILLSP
jgi:hypothetical protein